MLQSSRFVKIPSTSSSKTNEWPSEVIDNVTTEPPSSTRASCESSNFSAVPVAASHTMTES
eukprot:CAMPEP_0198655258 /NCGR_PEP_ID=MMETSP1467-20131203/8244_1 /TAXON_ID=1462469 /ORGANISM="unid. sp., Strain CCMP2135" /LENGTH=60 /DNA_ID=CAMNT_0044391261 /DNA_START=79 /DNA_END=261 /DNA_ORIENTATION=-